MAALRISPREQAEWHIVRSLTSNLTRRVWQHKNGLIEGFTKRYGVHRLVWYEVHVTIESAIAREKAIKEWKRGWKIELLEISKPRMAGPSGTCMKS